MPNKEWRPTRKERAAHRPAVMPREMVRWSRIPAALIAAVTAVLVVWILVGGFAGGVRR